MDGNLHFDFKTPLQNLTKALGDFAPDWAASENLDTISYWNSNFNRDQAVSIPLEVFLELQQVFGNALCLKFSLGDLCILDLGAPVTQESIDEFSRQTEHAESLVFSFEINKNELLNLKGVNSSQSARTILIFYASFFERMVMEANLDDLEINLWKDDPSKKTIVLIPEKNIFLDGSFLAVVGGDKLSDILTTIPAEPNNTGLLKDINERRANCVYWQSNFVKSIIPNHLNFVITAGEDELITRSLLIHRVNIVLLYIADRTITRNRKFTSLFISTQQSIEVCFIDPRTYNNSYLLQGANSIYKAFEWVYDDRWNISDRLPMVQIGVVNALNASDQDFRQTLLIENAPSIFENLQWHWKTFIEGKIGEYTNQINIIEEFVSSSVKGFTEQINSLLKSLSDTMLAAVGAFIGSFIAALFSDNFNDLVFRLGLFIYVGYVFFFPCLFNMINQWGHYKAFVQDFEARQKRYEARLYEEKVKEIVGDQFTSGKTRYRSAFTTILIIYGIIIIICTAAAIILPPIIHNSIEIMQPTIIPTETLSPISTAQAEITSTIEITPMITPYP